MGIVSTMGEVDQLSDPMVTSGVPALTVPMTDLIIAVLLEE